MNNSLVQTEDVQDDVLVILRKRETELVNLIEAIQKVSETAEWNILYNSLFAERETKLQNMILDECRKDVIDTNILYKLQGQLSETKKYDFDTLVTNYRREITSIRIKLQKTYG